MSGDRHCARRGGLDIVPYVPQKAPGLLLYHFGPTPPTTAYDRIANLSTPSFAFSGPGPDG